MPWIWRPSRRRVVREDVVDGEPVAPGPPHPFAFFGNPLLMLAVVVMIVAVVVIVLAIDANN